MKRLLNKVLSRPSAIFVLLDAFFIVFSIWASFLLRFDGIIPVDRINNFYAISSLAILITIPVFFFGRLYKISWKYVSLTNLPSIIKSVLASGLIIGAALFFLKDQAVFRGFPRSILFIYTIILLFFIVCLRFSKRIYWQILKSEKPLTEEFILPITAGTLNDKKIRNVLVTGGAGYIGSVLVRQLLNRGYKVRVLDKLLFGLGSIVELKSNPKFELIQGDIFNKEVLAKSLSDVDAVVHLAAIVGEPACVCQKDVALQTNYLGTVYVARLCKAMGIKRFVQASTCSTYGQNEEDNVSSEKSKLFPVDFYGETKIYAERELLKLSDEHFHPTILRFSTVYGLSPRMRFDLVVNTLTKKAVVDKEITIFGGNQWRPFLHVQDISRAVAAVLEAPFPKVADQIFNVGSNSENYVISNIGKLVKDCMPYVKIKIIEDISDERNYKIDFTKIEKILDFKNEKTVKDGIIEIRDAIKKCLFKNTEDKIYYNHLV